MLKCANLTIIDANIVGGLYVENGTLDLQGVKVSGSRCITACDNSVCNLDSDCVIEGDGTDAAVVVWNGALNTAADISCAGENYAISGNGTVTGDITINGGKITSAEDSAIYLPHGGTCVINAGEIEGKDGIYQKSGNLIVNGGSIKGNGDAEYKYSGNGSNAMGYGIVVEFTNYPGGLPNLTVNGGEISSVNKEPVGYFVSPKLEGQDVDALVAEHVTIKA